MLSQLKWGDKPGNGRGWRSHFSAVARGHCRPNPPVRYNQ